VTRSLAVIISSILAGHYAPGALARWRFRAAGKTLGDFHPLARGLADRLQRGVVDIARLGHELGELDRAAADQIIRLRIIPFPDGTRGGGQLDEGLGCERFLTAVAEGPAIGGNTELLIALIDKA